jgi:hypothetical protein
MTANIRNALVGSVVAFAAAALPIAGRAAAPGVGDTYVYSVVNKYSKEALGQLSFRVEKAGADSVTVSVTPSAPSAGAARTHVYAKGGNWLRHPVESHGKPVEYVFTTPYPAYVFPLEKGKSWSQRVQARVEGSKRIRSVRVDGRVLGNERVRVPAGEFDVIVIRRLVYTGDAEDHLTETQVMETEWYAPALGRPVRFERNSGWLDTSQCGRGRGCDFKGDWNMIELVEAPASRR